MQNLITSMVRFSTALTLFGIEQLERAANEAADSKVLSKTMDRLQEALNEMTDVLAGKLDENKRDALNSLSNASREAVQAGVDFLQKTTDATSEWLTKASDVLEKKTTEREPSAEAVSQPSSSH